ncbi:T9SS type A sorting domain-containing protein, partial [candidate division WOR-3 bacterium]|nr:T9SS type A sorting domain-containing protein [candidate division WOR-3 bacterium]
ESTWSFDNWPMVDVPGTYTTFCSTWVAGDTLAANNVITGSFTVRRRVTWPAGWTEVAPLPAGTAVKDGGWLAFDEAAGLLYAMKGNKSPEFCCYNAEAGTNGVWTTLLPIPNGTEAKPPYKGAAGCVAGDYVYATKGNNTSGFWRYSISGNTWLQMPDVPPGPSGKRVKGGTDVVYALEGDTGYVYLLKGYKQDFFRFNTVSGAWDTNLPQAPAGARPKWDKGSWLALDARIPTNPKVYAHKAKYHEMWSFDVPTHTWGTTALPGMPLVGMMGKSKKSKDGGCAASFEGALYALKGGNTQEFWKYTIATSAWTELDTMPAFGSTAKKKRVKAGGDIAAFGGGAFFALKGNKTLELWRYVEPAAPGSRPERGAGAQSGRGVAGPLSFAVAPSVVSGGRATLSYSLPAGTAARVRAFDAAGREVRSRSFVASRSGATGLDVSGLAAGVYLLRLEADGFVAGRKLVVQ